MNFFLCDGRNTDTSGRLQQLSFPQYRGQSSIYVNIDITDENNYPPLVYVFSRYIFVRSSPKMVLSKGWVTVVVVSAGVGRKMNKSRGKSSRKSNIETPVTLWTVLT